MADELIASLRDFYQEIEQILQADFYHPQKFMRVHSSQLEIDSWADKISDPAFSSYMGATAKRFYNPQLKAIDFGVSEVRQAGYIALGDLLIQSRQRFKSDGCLIQTEILHDDINSILSEYTPSADKWAIIDCRGYRAASSPWWQYLPFALAKGELLLIHCPNLNLKEIWNAGFFILPQEKDLYIVGATFSWTELDEIPTETAKLELLRKFENQVRLPYTILEQKAGVRPAVDDRRPLIGSHPAHANLFCFNGLGTKGVMLAPFFSAHFTAHLRDGSGLLPEVNLDRFKHHFGGSIEGFDALKK